MTRLSTVRVLLFSTALLGLAAGCSSDEGAPEPAIASPQQVGTVSEQTPAPQMAAQRAAVAAPENAQWAAPPEGGAQKAVNLLSSVPPGALAGAGTAEQAERRFMQGEAPVPGAAAAMPTASVPMAEQEAARGNGDTEARLRALEGQVSDLRKEFNSMLPAIRALIAEKDQSAKMAASAAVAAAAPKAAAEVAPVAEKKAKEAPVASSKGAKGAAAAAEEVAASEPAAGAVGGAVSDLRVGVHPDKTRIVFDLGGPVKASQDLDNEEKLLIVDLPGMLWKGATQKNLSQDSLLSSWTAQPSSDGKGSTVAFQLRKSAKILSSTQLKPSEGKGYRLVIDLAAE